MARRIRSIGIRSAPVLPLTGGYRIPRPGARTGYDSSGEQRRAARAVRAWPDTLSVTIPRNANAFQRVVTSKDARRHGLVRPSQQFVSPDEIQ